MHSGTATATTYHRSTAAAIGAASGNPGGQSYPRGGGSALVVPLSPTAANRVAKLKLGGAGSSHSSTQNNPSTSATTSSSANNYLSQRANKPFGSGTNPNVIAVSNPRLYMAPLASIRSSGDHYSSGKPSYVPSAMASSSSNHHATTRFVYGNGKEPPKSSAFGTNAAVPPARRRRGTTLERQDSTRSITGEFSGCNTPPRAPRLWRREDEDDDSNHLNNSKSSQSSFMAAMHSSSPEILMQNKGGDSSPVRPRRRWMMDQTSERQVMDESNPGDTKTTSYYCAPYRNIPGGAVVPRQNSFGCDNHHHADTKTSPKSCRTHSLRSFLSPANLIQLLVLALLVVFVYNSHHRVESHKVKLREYDEERSHLLNQMMWIDRAAKKVHTRYSALLQSDPSLESREELIDESRFLRDELNRLQVRIQLNARDRIHQLFGNKPLHVRFPVVGLAAEALQLGGTSKPSLSSASSTASTIAIALSDDTPHAVATLLTQVVEGQLWDGVSLEAAEPGVVQISSTLSTSSPLLEFVEPSRGCHEAGSVALRSIVKDELAALLLRVLMVDKAPMTDKDVCIGRVLSGLEALNEAAALNNDRR